MVCNFNTINSTENSIKRRDDFYMKLYEEFPSLFHEVPLLRYKNRLNATEVLYGWIHLSSKAKEEILGKLALKEDSWKVVE